MTLVYKYLPPERISYAEDELLRLTQPGEMNDPFECIPFIPEFDPSEFIDQILEQSPFLPEIRYPGDKKRIKKFKKSIPKRRADLLKHYRDNPEYLPQQFLDSWLTELNRNVGILSLSRRWDSSLMWAHYARSHRGFCLGFDRSHPVFHRDSRDYKGTGEITSITYSRHRIAVPITINDPMPIDPSYLKSLDWEYEEEERLVKFLSLASRKNPAQPFDLFLFRVPHSSLAELICGVNAADSLKAQIRSLANRLKVPVFETLISKTRFDMERRESG